MRDRIHVQFRWMIRLDLAEVLPIEEESFVWHSWTKEDFLDLLRRRSSVGMVAEAGMTVVGFMVFELLTNKIQLHKLAVGQKCQRRGVGAQMMAHLIAKLSSRRRPFLVMDVAEDNLGAQKFFQAMGFQAVAIMPRHFDHGALDAYRMAYCAERKEWDADEADASTPLHAVELGGEG